MNRLDEGVAMVLKNLDDMKLRKNTMIIYISDHGADFPRAKGTIYECGNRIPMIVNYPKSFSKGKVENQMVNTLDILPTMMKEIGMKIPSNFTGQPLQDLDTGKRKGLKFIHTFTTGSSPNLLYLQFGIRNDRYKLIYNPSRDINLLGRSRYTNSKLPKDQHVKAFLFPDEYELYDLKEDPYEWKNLAESAKHQDIKKSLLKAMKDFQERIKDPFADKENIDKFIAEQKKHKKRSSYSKKNFRWPHLDMFEESNGEK